MPLSGQASGVASGVHNATSLQSGKLLYNITQPPTPLSTHTAGQHTSIDYWQSLCSHLDSCDYDWCKTSLISTCWPITNTDPFDCASINKASVNSYNSWSISNSASGGPYSCSPCETNTTSEVWTTPWFALEDGYDRANTSIFLSTTTYVKGGTECTGPSFTWSSQCTTGCGQCTLGIPAQPVYNGYIKDLKKLDVRIIFWDNVNSVRGNDSLPGLSIAVTTNGHVLVSPTVYLSIASIKATDRCSVVGRTFSDIIVPLTEGEISTLGLRGPDINTPAHVTEVLNISILAGPVPISAWTAQPRCWPIWCDDTSVEYCWQLECIPIWEKLYQPLLVIPPAVQALDPAWADCILDLEGLPDPPFALTAIDAPAMPPGMGNPDPPADLGYLRTTSAAPHATPSHGLPQPTHKGGDLGHAPDPVGGGGAHGGHDSPSAPDGGGSLGHGAGSSAGAHGTNDDPRWHESSGSQYDDPGRPDPPPHLTHGVDASNNPLAHDAPRNGQEDLSGADNQTPPVRGGNAPTRPSSTGSPRLQNPQLSGWRLQTTFDENADPKTPQQVDFPIIGSLSVHRLLSGEVQINGQIIQSGSPPQLINGNLVNLAKGDAVWIETPGNKPILAGWIRDDSGSSRAGIWHWIPVPSGLGDGDLGPPTSDHRLESFSQVIGGLTFAWDPSDPLALQLDGKRILPGATSLTVMGHTISLSKAGDSVTINGHEYPVMEVWNRESSVASPRSDPSRYTDELDPSSDSVLGGQTLSPGNSVMTISGTVFSLMGDGAGVLIEGISRWSLPSGGLGYHSSGPATLTFDGITYVIDGNGDYVDDHLATLDSHFVASAIKTQQPPVNNSVLSNDDNIGNVVMNGFGPSATVSLSEKSAGSRSSLTPNLIRGVLVCFMWMLLG